MCFPFSFEDFSCPMDSKPSLYKMQTSSRDLSIWNAWISYWDAKWNIFTTVCYSQSIGAWKFSIPFRRSSIHFSRSKCLLLEWHRMMWSPTYHLLIFVCFVYLSMIVTWWIAPTYAVKSYQYLYLYVILIHAYKHRLLCKPKNHPLLTVRTALWFTNDVITLKATPRQKTEFYRPCPIETILFAEKFSWLSVVLLLFHMLVTTDMFTLIALLPSPSSLY